MNEHTNNTTFLHDNNGCPAWAVVPYDEYLKLTARADEDVSIPGEVVNIHVQKEVSLARAWREHLGLTQAEVAKRMGVTQPAYAQMEKAGHKLRPSTAKRIAEALGVEWEQIREDDMT